MSSNLEWAQWYLSKGFCVIPVGFDKKPRIAWKEYQSRKSTNEELAKWWGEWPESNIGLVTGAISDLFVIDLDTQDAVKQVNDMLPDTAIIPTVQTPRGGRHLYFKHIDGFANKAGVAPGIDVRTTGGYIVAPPSKNGRGNKYSWIVGMKDALNSVEIYSFLYSFLLRDKDISKGCIYTRDIDITLVGGEGALKFGKGYRDQTLFHIANCLTKGGMPPIEIQDLLTKIATCICNPPFPQSEVKAKILSAMQRQETSEKSIMQAVREFIAVTDGKFRVTDVEQYLLPLLPAKKSGNKPILMALSRLTREGLIERLPLPATYRTLKNSYQGIHIKDVQEGTWLDVSLPFNLHRYVRLAPGNMVVFAGVTNAGKSALILNMIRDNMSKHKCVYISSEMSAAAVKGRLNKMDDKTDWNFTVIDNWDQSPDVLEPGAFNFLDWVEAGEEPFRVADRLSKIQSKLQSQGLVVVAMQKNKASTAAIGGEQTMSKASLYLTVNPDYPGQRMTVTKAKAFDDINPNDFSIKFKIVKGINLLPLTEWGPELAAGETTKGGWK